jgi:hypothetical protein
MANRPIRVVEGLIVLLALAVILNASARIDAAEPNGFILKVKRPSGLHLRAGI